MRTKSVVVVGFILLIVGAVTLPSRADVRPVSFTAAWATAAESSSTVGITSSCGVVSCTIYLPVVLNPLPLLPAQFEVTQGIQQPDNSVRLIANRPTYVRWTLTSSTADANVTVYLYGTRNGVALPGSPIAALNNPQTLKATANRTVLNDTFNFRLPDTWPSGDISLSAQATNPTGFFKQTTAPTFHFAGSAALSIKVVPIEYHCTNSSSVILPGDPPYTYLSAYTYRVYPVPSIASTTHAAIRYDGPCTNNLPTPASSDWGGMLNTVTSVWSSEGSPNIYYYGLLKVNCGGGCIAGMGWIGWPAAAVGFDGTSASHSGASETQAHEVGHNHGSQHAPGCGAAGPDPAFPYVPADGRARIGDGAHPNFGFNIDTQAIYPYSSTYYDLMSYCGPEWVSDYTYNKWWTFDNTLRAAASTGDRSFLISGAIDPSSDRVTFDPAYAIDVPARLPDHGDYTIELLDGSDHVLAAYPFAPLRAQPDRIGTTESEPEVIGFHFTLPYVDRVAALRVRHGTGVVGTLRAGQHAPALRIENRSGQISWTAADTDREPVHYLVRASTDDGVTWQTIGVNLVRSSITIDPNAFGGQRASIEVLASDGVHTSSARIRLDFKGEK